MDFDEIEKMNLSDTSKQFLKFAKAAGEYAIAADTFMDEYLKSKAFTEACEKGIALPESHEEEAWQAYKAEHNVKLPSELGLFYPHE